MSLLGTGPRAEFPHRFLIGKMSLRTFVSAVDASTIEFCCRALLLYSQNVGSGEGACPSSSREAGCPRPGPASSPPPSVPSLQGRIEPDIPTTKVTAASAGTVHGSPAS